MTMRNTAAALGALVLVAVGGSACSSTPQEMTFEDYCALWTGDITSVYGVEDAGEPGVGWNEHPSEPLAAGRYTVYRRTPGEGLGATDGWEVVDDVELAQGDPRRHLLPDLPAGTWEVGVTAWSPDCGEAVLCVEQVCTSTHITVARERE